MPRRLTTDEFIEKARKKYGDRYDYSLVKYKNMDTKVAIVCRKHDVFRQTPKGHLRGKEGCKNCASKKISESKRYPYTALQKDCERLGLTLLESEETYRNLNQRVRVRCTICENDWNPFAGNVRSGHGCSTCSGSISEEICRRIMEQAFGEKFPTKRPDWIRNEAGSRLELDGYCEELAIAFEHHGLQHTELTYLNQRDQSRLNRQLLHDQTKREACEQRGIRLLEFYRLSFTTKFNPSEMRQVFEDEFERVGLPNDVLGQVEFDAESLLVRKSKIDEVNKLLADLNIRCVSNSYIGNRAEYEFQCLSCEYVWPAYWVNTVRGKGCPRCGGFEELNTEKVTGWLEREKSLLLIGHFKNSQTKIEVECPRRHRTKARFDTIKRWKYDCPTCHGNAKLDIADVAAVAKCSQIELLSTDYVNARTDMIWKCVKGHTWPACYDKIRAKQGCPICAGKTSNLENLRQYLADYNIRLMSSEFRGARETYVVQCANGHRNRAFLPDLKRWLRRETEWCNECSRI